MRDNVITFLISSSVLIMVIVLLRGLCLRHISMRVRYLLWLLAAVKLLVFPVPWIVSGVSIFNLPDRIEALMGQEKEPGLTQTAGGGITGDEDALEGYESAEGEVENPGEDSRLSVLEEDGNSALEIGEKAGRRASALELVLGIMAAAGSCMLFFYGIYHNLRFGNYLKNHRNRLESYEVQLPFEMDLPVYEVEHLPSPCLYGRAIYAAPECIVEDTKRKHILAHEYSHYMQGDLVWSAIRGICLCLYWWHPLVWVAAYLSKQDGELSCDEAALRRLGESERLDYGKTLLSLVTEKPAPKDLFSVATTMTSGKNSLKRRIAAISKKVKVNIGVCVLVILAAIIGLAATITSRKEEQEQTLSGLYTTEGTEDETEEDIADTVDYSLMSGEELQEMAEEGLWQGNAQPDLYVYDISVDNREIDVWSFVADAFHEEYYWYYDQAKRNGVISSKALPFSDYCTFYVDEQVGSLAATEVDFDTFMDYIALRSGQTEPYGSEAPECRCTMLNGAITSIELTNPYPGITNVSSIYSDHYYYENYGTEEYYTLKYTCEAYLMHDKDNSEEDVKADYVEVYTGNAGDGDNGMVLVYSGYPENDPFSIEAHTSRAGWTNIYLVTINDKDYIFQLDIDARDGYGGCYYYVYRFGEQAGPNLAVVPVEGAAFEYRGDPDMDSYDLWSERMYLYLKDARLLLSTQDGVVRAGPGNDYERYNGAALLEYLAQY